MEDYVVFDSKKDMLDKIRYYIEHENERQEIAYNGYKKVTDKYNHIVFWNKITERLSSMKLM